MGYPGQAAGTALARMLFGLDSPSGRLPHTFYRSRYLDAVNMKQMNLRADVRTGYPGRTMGRAGMAQLCALLMERLRR